MYQGTVLERCTVGVTKTILKSNKCVVRQILNSKKQSYIRVRKCYGCAKRRSFDELRAENNSSSATKRIRPEQREE